MYTLVDPFHSSNNCYTTQNKRITANKTGNDWLDAVSDVTAGQFGAQALTMFKSVKLAVEIYLGTLGTFAKEGDRPWVGLSFYADNVEEGLVDSTYPFYATFEGTL